MQSAHDAEIPKEIDWSAIASEFHAAKASVRAIARSHGITETAIRKHAKRRGWVRPERLLDVGIGVGRLAQALAANLAAIDGAIERSRRFVAAMVELGAGPESIADALQISVAALLSEFGRELEGGER